MRIQNANFQDLIQHINRVNTCDELNDNPTVVLVDVINHLEVSDDCVSLVRKTSDLINDNCIGDTGNLISEPIEAVRDAGYHVDIMDYPGGGSRKLVVVFTRKGLIDG